jgi:acyl-CoA synthetase (AMP-forming)/AMP-acid ligase II
VHGNAGEFANERTLIVANHESFLDGLLLGDIPAGPGDVRRAYHGGPQSPERLSTALHSASGGDIVEFDADDFIHIRGRVKRFAKIAGEMISLEVVERNAAQAAPGFAHAATSRADAAKGEAIVLFTTAPDLMRDQLKALAAAAAEPQLAPA